MSTPRTLRGRNAAARFRVLLTLPPAEPTR